MTEEEARELAARLARVWKPTEPVSRAKYREGEPGKAATWLFHANLSGNLELEMYTSERGNVSSIDLTRWIEGRQDRAFLLACEEEEDWKIEDVSELWADELEMLPLFRKNCWLSGADIEASAHEKAEWMRGFNEEETEEWQLKI